MTNTRSIYFILFLAGCSVIFAIVYLDQKQMLKQSQERQFIYPKLKPSDSIRGKVTEIYTIEDLRPLSNAMFLNIGGKKIHLVTNYSKLLNIKDVIHIESIVEKDYGKDSISVHYQDSIYYFKLY
ncbi:MAG TPA: hypothetical protein PKL31_15470 [Fulvivirga sp.]|nr:hypothetical protein [Fulvivirga sp.]